MRQRGDYVCLKCYRLVDGRYPAEDSLAVRTQIEENKKILRDNFLKKRVFPQLPHSESQHLTTRKGRSIKASQFKRSRFTSL